MPETFAVFSRGQRKLDTIWLVAIWCACADNIYLVLICLDSEWRSHDRCSTRSVPCLLMPWPLICPCHHRLWYGLFVNTFKPRQTGRHFADDISKFVPKGPINNIPTLVQIMAWPSPGAKPLCERKMISLSTHIFVTRPQWIKPWRGFHLCATIYPRNTK